MRTARLAGFCASVFLLLSTISSSSFAASIPNETAWAAGTNWEYKSNFAGYPTAWVYTPASHSPRTPGKRGVVFHMIGCGQRAFQVAQGAGWPEAAEAYGLVIVVPEATAPVHPNKAATNVECLDYGFQDNSFLEYSVTKKPTVNTPDHKLLIAAARAAPSLSLDIDPKQVYVTGLSAGAAVAMDMLCMAPDVFTAAGVAAGPAIGSRQNQAVMPASTQGVSLTTVRNDCNGWRGSKSMAENMLVLYQDNNSLPPGNPIQVNGIWTADKFINLQIWDGDKYVDNTFHGFTTTVFAEMFGLSSSPSETDTVLGSGTGVGCPGGESSVGTGGEVQCWPKDAVTRQWDAQADIWRDGQNRVRLVRIDQDTLRHAWPAGDKGINDFDVTPTKQDLIDMGIVDTSTGSYNLDKANAAKNGVLGGLYVNRSSIDYSMYLAKTFTENNPRLGAPWSGGTTNTAPTITLKGENPATVNQNATYTDAGANASDAEDGDLTSAITSTCNVNTAVAGSYSCVYTVTDKGGLNATALRVVNVIAQQVNQAPVITLNGANPASVMQNATYTDAGATATDAEDGNLTNAIASTCNVNTASVGSYSCVYTVTDSGGLNATALRVVNVVAQQSNQAPTITLNGANPMKLNVGSTFTDPGATANDAEDGNLTNAIQASCNVNTNTAGSYACVYSVADSQGATATALRTVTVEEVVVINLPPSITLKGANPMTINQGDSFADPGATASDPEDGDLSDQVVAICNVNTATAGNYNCSYSVADSNGQVSTASRTVVVKAVNSGNVCKQYTAYLLNHRYAGRVVSTGWFGAAEYYTVGGNEKLEGAWWSLFTVHDFNADGVYHAGACP